MARSAASSLYIGLMSGTSLDGVDGVLASIPDNGQAVVTIASAYVPFPDHLRAALLALQHPGEDELHLGALAAAELVRHYTQCVDALLHKSGRMSASIRAIGVHGQTVRHRPELGYTCQINHPGLLAEQCGIDVIADFRSRDIAAGGQGAPLVPAFHRAAFGSDDEARVVVNIGGIGNISILPAGRHSLTAGFDTGPGNVLMDAWIAMHLGQAYDAGGTWAASGTPDAGLLSVLRSHAYFALPPPKSTGRDLFHLAWLQDRLAGLGPLPAADVQATLAALTADTIADAILTHAPATEAVYLCGGGAHNVFLTGLLERALQTGARRMIPVASTAALGIAPQHVEALAFAWLAQRFCLRLPGNLPVVTGARGPRILGALYPAG